MNSESIRNCAAPAGLSKNKLCFTSFASISMRASSTADCKRKRSSKQSLGKKRQDMTHMMRSQMVSQWSLNVQSLSPQINIKIQKKHGLVADLHLRGVWYEGDGIIWSALIWELRKGSLWNANHFFPLILFNALHFVAFKGTLQASTWGPSFDLKTPSAGTAVVHPS
jgi:hypothetical protein